MSESISHLRKAITDWNPVSAPTDAKPDRPGFPYAVWRFLSGWKHERETLGTEFGADSAVLLRQALRWSGGEVRLPQIREVARPLLARAGIEITSTGGLRALPFCPKWIVNDKLDPAHGIDTPPRHARTDKALPAERYLLDLGSADGNPAYTSWQSAAQKEAVWRALSMPRRSTSVVVLPTGTGKSLIFQLLAAYSQGLTVVVVPTVALAMDQWRAACEVAPSLKPRYYAANDNADSVIDAVKQGDTKLLITSPEACVTGKLRTVLEKLAADGRLDNLVIDEVHIVETWGAFFRVDFQLLSGVRETWLAKSTARLRTLLLTATLTPSGREDLRGLFPPAKDGVWWEFLSQRLRPEMVYFDQRFASEDERAEVVKQCVWRLPRPAILYVTERKEAVQWYRRLRNEEGFRRLGCFHGDTPASERRTLLDAWRGDKIDLMVATSAFGLGVDKPDVRSVLHACYPEDMNRYYQEVGRGGRDGWTTVCVLMPTDKDKEVAYGLGPKFMTPELLNERWQALSQPEFMRKVPSANEAVRQIDPSAVRREMLGKRTGQENILWNKRLLLQLQRAGLLSLRGVSYEQGQDGEKSREWIEVELKFNPNRKVGGLVEESRTEELAASASGLNRVAEYLGGKRCVSKVLDALYGDNVQRVCAGCRHCRVNGVTPRRSPELDWELTPRDKNTPQAVIVSGLPDPVEERDRFRALFRRCLEDDRKPVKRFATTQHFLELLCSIMSELYRELPLYLKTPYRIDAIDDSQVELLPDETLAVFHLGHTATGTFTARGGAMVIHWFRPPVTRENIRYPLHERGILDPGFFTSPDDWFRS